MIEPRDVIERVGERFPFPEDAFERMLRRRDRRRQRQRVLAGAVGLGIVLVAAAAFLRAYLSPHEGVPVTSPSPSPFDPAITDRAMFETPKKGTYLLSLSTGELTPFSVESWPDVAPDGRVVALGPDGGLAVTDPSGSDRQPLEIRLPEGAPTRPDWSPDGAKVAFDTSAGGFERGALFVYDLAAGTTEKIETTGQTPYAADWSPDGHTLLYLSPWGGTATKIRTVDLLTGEDTLVGPVNGADLLGHAARWSPDGTRILFECDDGGCTVAPDGSDMQEITRYPHWAWSEPTWSPDGTRIAYWSDADQPRIYVRDLASGEVRFVMDSAWQPVWVDDDTLLIRVAKCDANSCQF